MTAPRDPVLRLKDIIEAADKLARLVAMGRTAFDSDWMVSDLVVHELEIIGEAAAALPVDFRAAHHQVPWPQMIGMRNQLIHGYADIDHPIVWDTAVTNVPDLRANVCALLTDLEESHT